jgi:DNA primase large subunit
MKGIGLSMKDSLQLWKKEFTKKMSSDKFQREYAYNIRHSYGKEGKRTDYTPWSCGKLMRMTPS